MRKTLADFLVEKARADDKVIFLTGDLGFQVFEKFQMEFPNRYLNVGIAEAGMVGIAAGLARRGFIPFCYSIASFLLPRAFEQTRFFSGYNSLRCIYIGAGGGFAYGESGATHHSLDDIGLAKLIPNLDVYVPSGPKSLNKALNLSLNSPQSSYIQIGKFGEIDVESKNMESKAPTLIVTYGPVSRLVELAISKSNQDCRLLILTRLKPFPREQLFNNLQGVKKVILIEEQFATSGVQSEITQCLFEFKYEFEFQRLGPSLEYSHKVQNQELLRESNGFSTNQIIDCIESDTKE